MSLPTAPTYSIGVKGLPASGAQSGFNGGTASVRKVHIIPDTSDNGNALQDPAVCYGGHQSVMSDGDSFLYKNPDGAIKRGKFDAERSTPGNPVVIPV